MSNVEPFPPHVEDNLQATHADLEDDRKAYASDPYWIHDMIKHSFYAFACKGDRFNGNPFDKSNPQNDVRGRTFQMSVAEDGMSLTWTEV